MDDLIPITPELRIEFPDLSDEERSDLETFLSAQPEVKSIQHRTQVRDSAPSRETIGLIVVHYHLVVELGKSVLEIAGQAALAELVRRWIASLGSRKGQDANTETVPLLGPDGRTVKVVKRPKLSP